MMSEEAATHAELEAGLVGHKSPFWQLVHLRFNEGFPPDSNKYLSYVPLRHVAQYIVYGRYETLFYSGLYSTDDLKGVLVMCSVISHNFYSSAFVTPTFYLFTLALPSNFDNLVRLNQFIRPSALFRIPFYFALYHLIVALILMLTSRAHVDCVTGVQSWHDNQVIEILPDID
jgi:hypothetical protein